MGSVFLLYALVVQKIWVLKGLTVFPIFIVAIIIIISSIVIWSTWYMATSTTINIIITCHLLRRRRREETGAGDSLFARLNNTLICLL